MDALHQLLHHVATGPYSDDDYQRAMLALLNRVDIAQDATVAMRRKAYGDVVDAAIAPDGRVFVVERRPDSARLYEWIHAPLKSKFVGIASAEFISLYGFPDGKTLAYATYSHDVGGRLRFGDWSSDPIPFRADDGAMFWESDGTIHAVARNWKSSDVAELRFFRLPETAPVSTFNGRTICHAVLHGRLAFIYVNTDGPRAAVCTDLDHADIASRIVRVGETNLADVRFPSAQDGPSLVTLSEHMWSAEERAGRRRPLRYAGRTTLSEGRLYVTRMHDLLTPGGDKPWVIEVHSIEDKEWTWYRDHVSALRGICYLPASGHTVLLVDPNTKFKADRLDVVMIDKDGKEFLTERVDGATGKMRRVGNVVIVEGKDEHGMTLSTFDAGGNMGPIPLVGKFDRLSALANDKVVGWQYAEGIISVQQYN